MEETFTDYAMLLDLSSGPLANSKRYRDSL